MLQDEILRIIKEKRVNVNQLLKAPTLWSYNKMICAKNRQLTQAEFDLLKEWLQ